MPCSTTNFTAFPTRHSSENRPRNKQSDHGAHGLRIGTSSGKSSGLRQESLPERSAPRRLAPHADQSEPRASRRESARRDLPRPLGGGNSIPCMEAGAQPQQRPQSQEQRTSSASPGLGRVRRIRSRPETRRTRQANSKIPRRIRHPSLNLTRMGSFHEKALVHLHSGGGGRSR